jgi:FdhD protein
MRTPGEDTELAAGFLYSEGVVRSRQEIAGCVETAKNAVRVDLAAGVRPNLTSAERAFYVSSSCGVCGKASIEAIRLRRTVVPNRDGPLMMASVVRGLPSTLRRAQAAFERTGGLHAAGLFDPEGRLEAVREDVGRHNALDKLLGGAWLSGPWPLLDRAVLLSGRASFELLQKAAMSGVSIVAAVGAPSTLAVEMASEAGITLLGFVRSDGFNVYTGAHRIVEAPDG